MSGVDAQGRVRLDTTWGEAENAARLGHLAGHLRDRPDAFLPGDCEAQVSRAVRLEAEGYARELGWRRALGVEGSRYPFDGDPERIAAWLWAHPAGGEGVDAIVDGYRARCAAAQPVSGGSPGTGRLPG